MIVLTGDTHGDFDRIEEFCAEYDTTEDDVMVILGDAGLNYWLDERDDELKRFASRLPVTLLCVYGNHEERPCNVPGYETTEWRGGEVWYQPEYPNLLFAEDGEVYDLEGKQAIVIGGAYSVDKFYRLANHLAWFPEEQPDAKIKTKVEHVLDRLGWRVDCVLSHTVPISCVPRDMFLPTVDQSTVDRSTEQWLQKIADRLDHERWYAGHYHVTRDVGRVHILYEDYEELEGNYENAGYRTVQEH